VKINPETQATSGTRYRMKTKQKTQHRKKNMRNSRFHQKTMGEPKYSTYKTPVVLFIVKSGKSLVGERRTFDFSLNLLS
jgi:hypothetical protein